MSNASAALNPERSEPQVCSSGVMTANWPSAAREKANTPKESAGLCPSQVEARSVREHGKDPAKRALAESTYPDTGRIEIATGEPW